VKIAPPKAVKTSSGTSLKKKGFAAPKNRGKKKPCPQKIFTPEKIYLPEFLFPTPLMKIPLEELKTPKSVKRPIMEKNLTGRALKGKPPGNTPFFKISPTLSLKKPIG